MFAFLECHLSCLYLVLWAISVLFLYLVLWGSLFECQTQFWAYILCYWVAFVNARRSFWYIICYEMVLWTPVSSQCLYLMLWGDLCECQSQSCVYICVLRQPLWTPVSILCLYLMLWGDLCERQSQSCVYILCYEATFVNTSFSYTSISCVFRQPLWTQVLVLCLYLMLWGDLCERQSQLCVYILCLQAAIKVAANTAWSNVWGSAEAVTPAAGLKWLVSGEKGEYNLGI